MANVKISALSAATLANGDALPIVSGGVTKKAILGQFGENYIPYANASGNVLIGTNADFGYKTSIVGGASKLFLANTDYGAVGTGTALYHSGGSGNVLFMVQNFTGGGSTKGGIALNPQGGNVLIGTTTDASTGKLQVAGNATPSAHNTYDLGTTAVRWKDLWLQSGAFNGSDARLKTEIMPFTDKEIEASKRLAKEIGTYQWLQSVAEKGADKARHHVGLTVQKAIQIMQDCGLNPFDYGFIGYDKWDDRIVHHPEIKAEKAVAAVLDDDGNVVTPAREAVKAEKAWDEVVLKAGDAFSFRYDQLNMFIARGFEARLSALEASLS